MDANTENKTEPNATPNSTYAEVLAKSKTSSVDASNNNPISNHSISNGNEQLLGVNNSNNNEDGAILDDSKNSNQSSNASSLNDSFEDAEDSQLDFNSSASKHLSSDIKTSEEIEDSTVSGEVPTTSDDKTSSALEMNESNSSVDSNNSGEESDLEDERNNLDTLFPTALKWKFRPSNPVGNLPETVTVLETDYGSKVYLVGTAHFSLESQEDVAKTIQAVQPDSVMIELCKSRVNMLSLDEATILEEAKGLSFQKIATTLEQNGLLQGVLYFLLLSMSAHLTKQLGMAPGGEFRRAYNEAQKVPGCVVHLGDRPIHITLQRALAKLSLWQKIRIAWHMLRAKGPISKEEVERCKQKDLLEEMLAEMTGEFPELSQVFVTERDIYLTYSLQMAALPQLSPHSHEVATPSTVVGVVGIGHVPGIKERWGKVRDEDIPAILHIPESSRTSKIIRKCIRFSVYGLGLYGLYKIIPRSLVPKRLWLTNLSNSVF
ncbi:traB domain-containing protein-like [Argiope bruennichi]|uniref:traB domain-containing protein-like n=1 Tax=Argiope bruennichi TaxID=94029 RepID=UPI0024952297|nr:traB domain-containing protein-like [Argiope bruennichi]